MPNIRTLFSDRDGDDDSDPFANDGREDRYVGGVGAQGGGSGLAVRPNPASGGGSGSGGGENLLDSIRGRATEAGGGGGGPGGGPGESPPRRVITMYASGFTVSDGSEVGPYRPLNDPANGEFLRALAAGRTPRELVEEGAGGEEGEVCAGGGVGKVAGDGWEVSRKASVMCISQSSSERGIKDAMRVS